MTKTVILILTMRNEIAALHATSSEGPWERLRKAADFSPKCAPSMFADSSIDLILSKPASTGETRKM
jgi:hypothetical protein